jgi:4-amino-4-deoxy-L-arabinose transferase-like glycosyltransferase
VTHKSSYGWIALALALYLFFSLTFLELPGLYYDETNFITAAFGHTSGLFIAWSARIFGHKVPLMIMNYIGALKSGIYAPVFALFGTSAATVRIPVVLIGLITLLSAYAVFRRMFDRTIAIVALLLFATDCTFIFANRLDWGPVSVMLALEASSLYFLWRWMTEDKNHFLAIAGFLLGLGLWNKIIFVWFLVALFTALLLCYHKHFINLLHWRRMAWFVPAFLLGCLPLIAYNIDVPMGTFRRQTAISFPTLEAINLRYHVFRGTLDGFGVYYLVNHSEVGTPERILKSPPVGALDRTLSALSGIPWVGRSPLPIVFLASLVLLLILLGRKHLKGKREIVFLGLHLPVIAFMMCLNPLATGAHHAIAVYPFVFILIAYAVCEFTRWLGKSRTARILLLCLCLLPLIAAHVVVDARYLKSFQVNGGCRFWSDAIYSLADYTREHPDKTYYLMEWGFSTQLVFLSNGSLRYQDFSCNQQELEACMEPLLTQANTSFVFHTPAAEDRPLLNIFKQTLARHQLHGRTLKTFYQRDGQPVYILYEIVPASFEAHASKVGFYYMREGEDFDGKSGGDLDSKGAASNKKALGSFWGRQPDDYVTYRFSMPKDLVDARMGLRYAFEDRFAHEYYVLLDGNFVDTLTLPATSGYGYTPAEWKTFEYNLGNIEKGVHELKLKPGKQYQLLNLDYWYIKDGP